MKKITYLLSIGLMVSLLGCGDESVVVSRDKPTITKAEFNQIKNGMTYEQVTAIIGGPGEVATEGIYKYSGDSSFTFDTQLVFRGDKLIVPILAESPTNVPWTVGQQ